MILVGESTICLGANSSITFIKNHAYNYGGAIYYMDDYTKDLESTAELSEYFYGICSMEKSLENVVKYLKKKHITVEFCNNTAGIAGIAIYGGWVDLCQFYQASVFDGLFHFHQSKQQLSLISSNPTRVCLCTSMSIPDCSITNYTITAYPGETLTIPAVAVGQRFGTVPSTVQSSFVSGSNGRLPALQYTQLVNVNCTNLVYTILSVPQKTEFMKLTVEKHNIPRTKVINEALRNIHK